MEKRKKITFALALLLCLLGITGFFPSHLHAGDTSQLSPRLGHDCSPQTSLQLDSAENLVKVNDYVGALKILSQIDQAASRMRPKCRIRYYRCLGTAYSLSITLPRGEEYLYRAYEIADSLDLADARLILVVDLIANAVRSEELDKVILGVNFATKLNENPDLLPQTLAYYQERSAYFFQFLWENTQYPDSDFTNSSIRRLHKAIDYAREGGEAEIIASALNQIGYYSIPLSADSAYHYMHLSGVLYDSLDNRQGLALALFNQAMTARMGGDKTRFLIALDTCAKVIGDNSWQYLSRILALNYKHYYLDFERNIDSAFKYLNLELELTIWERNQSIENERQFREADILVMEKVRQQTQEIHSIGQDRATLRRILLLSGLFGLLLLGLLILLRRAYSNARQNAKLLEASNTELQHALQAKEVLMNEVHHRVKNNFQIMANLLKIQAGSSRIPELADELASSVARLMGMASIHETLYLQPEQQRIGLRTFLQHLGDEVLSVSVRAGNAQIAVEGDNPIASHSRAIHLGIVLQELVTNSCKHAMPTTGELRIRVDLEQKNGRLQFRYFDNGPGLPHELPGSGMGTFVIEMMVVQCNGEKIDSIGQGFIFGFEFKLAQTN